MSVAALLSLGGNLGDRKALIDAAVTRIAALPRTQLRARSSYYRTEPVGPVAQAWFVNIAIALDTGLSREALAAACRVIEGELGRDRSKEIPWGPRAIDIDVVVFGEATEVDERAFVLVPLAEISPRARIGGSTIGGLAAEADAGGVRRLDWPLPGL